MTTETDSSGAGGLETTDDARCVYRRVAWLIKDERKRLLRQVSCLDVALAALRELYDDERIVHEHQGDGSGKVEAAWIGAARGD